MNNNFFDLVARWTNKFMAFLFAIDKSIRSQFMKFVILFFLLPVIILLYLLCKIHNFLIKSYIIFLAIRIGFFHTKNILLEFKSLCLREKFEQIVNKT